MIGSDFFADHPIAMTIVGGVCLWISFSLILRMWLVHRAVSPAKKILWSFMLLLPLFGWLAYGAWFQIPLRHDMDLPPSSGT